MAQLVWLITGTTSGIGAALVKAISNRGDLVIATGRNVEQRLASIQSDNTAVLDLDLSAPRDKINTQVEKAIAIFGRIDVLINNAGVSDMSSIEETSDDAMARMFDVNLFGAWRVTQAVLPHMRARRQGRIGFVGSGIGWAPMPFVGVYSMAKAALGRLVDTLDKEVGPLGIRVVCFEAGGFPTNSGNQGQGTREDDKAAGGPPEPEIDDYQPGFRKQIQGFMEDVVAHLPGDTGRFPEAVIDVIKGEGMAQGRKWPVRVALGPDCAAVIRQKCRETMDMMDEWEDVSTMTIRDDWNGNVSPYMLNVCSMRTS